MTIPSNPGFRASLSGASLFDLVQLECTRATHGCVQVTSDGRLGYLYFDAGQIVHARYAGAIGERAVFEMLRWRSGEVTPVERPWPTRATILSGWQDLLLRAAQEQDETAPERVSSVGNIEARGADVLPFLPPGNRASDNTGTHRSVHLAEELREVGDDMNDPMASSDVLDFAEIDVDGELLREKGNAELLAQTGAYVARLATLIADSLGLEPFEQLHARSAQAQCVVRVERESIVALRAARRADLSSYLGAPSS